VDKELLGEHEAGTGSRQKLQSNRQSVDEISESHAHHANQNTDSVLDSTTKLYNCFMHISRHV